MAQDTDVREEIGPALSQEPDRPNFPEVSGTSLPLLSTLLAGFAVTITVQVMLRPDDPSDLSGKAILALIAFLLSTLLFLSSIIFAINAQAHNFLPFLDISSEGARLLNVDDVAGWLRRIIRRWQVFHWAAILSFYAGLALVLAGVNLIVWEFVGVGVALIVLLAIVLNLALTIGVTGYVDGWLSDRPE